MAAALERGGVPAPHVACIRSEIFVKSLNSLAFNTVAVLGDASNGAIADTTEAVAGRALGGQLSLQDVDDGDRPRTARSLLSRGVAQERAVSTVPFATSSGIGGTVVNI